MIYVLVLLLAVLPITAQAAYNDPVVEKSEVQPSGLTRVTLLFTGNAGEPDVRLGLLLGPGQTASEVRQWVGDQIQVLDSARTIATLPALQPGQTIPRAARSGRTAKQLWKVNYSIYLSMVNAGLTNATFIANLAAKKTWLDANYQDGFMDE